MENLIESKPNYREAEKLALELLKKGGYVNPPINPIAIARDIMGIEVFFVKFSKDDDDVLGLYDFHHKHILVKSDDSPNRKVFTIAHELGHLRMHKEWAESKEYKVMRRTDDFSKDVKEREADAFAAHLLVPKFILDRYYKIASVFELSKLFTVSEIVINKRLAFEYG